jgi:DNA-binding transcriptional MerR regulator
MYAATSIERVQLAQRALQLGFSLKELSEIFRTRDTGSPPCHRVLSLTEEKLHSLGQQIKELQQTQTYMRELVRDWRKKLLNTPTGAPAMLLQSLEMRSGMHKGSSTNLRRRKSRS